MGTVACSEVVSSSKGGGSHALQEALGMGMVWCPYVLGESCAGQMFAQHKSMAYKVLHYHLYMARVWCTEWHYLWALSSYTTAAGKLPPPPSSWEHLKWR